MGRARDDLRSAGRQLWTEDRVLDVFIADVRESFCGPKDGARLDRTSKIRESGDPLFSNEPAMDLIPVGLLLWRAGCHDRGVFPLSLYG